MSEPAVDSQQPYESPDDKGARSSREARRAARGGRARQYYGDEEVPTSDSALQDASHGYQQQQRHYSQQSSPRRRSPADKPRPAAEAAPPVERRDSGVAPSPKSLAPSFSGSVENEPPTRSGYFGHHQRTDVRRGPSDQPYPNSGQWGRPRPASGSPPAKVGNGRNRRPGPMTGKPSSPQDASTSGAAIARMESPTIAKNVLQPLERKIQEYDSLMAETQHQMAQLDEELRALQDRRQKVEDRFLEAKSKHTDYVRQHDDVDRALRGEGERTVMPPPAPMLQVPQESHGQDGMQAQQQAVSRPDTAASDDRRPVSKHSSRTRRIRARDRIRMSLFGGI